MTDTNVFEQNAKPATLTRIYADGTDDTIELGVARRLRDWGKDFDADFVRRNQGGARRLTDLENVEETWQVDALVSKEFIHLSQEEGVTDSELTFMADGLSAPLNDLEDLDLWFNDIMRYSNKGGDAPFVLNYGGVTVKGFISDLSIDEDAGRDNSVYLVQFNFQVALRA